MKSYLLASLSLLIVTIGRKFEILGFHNDYNPHRLTDIGGEDFQSSQMSEVSFEENIDVTPTNKVWYIDSLISLQGCTIQNGCFPTGCAGNTLCCPSRPDVQKCPCCFITEQPISAPTQQPVTTPTYLPVNLPTIGPTEVPTISPLYAPTISPEYVPTPSPTTGNPTDEPSSFPTNVPIESTIFPTNTLTFTPSVASKPSLSPSAIATPVLEPTHTPTDRPTSIPSSRPSFVPTNAPIESTIFPTNTLTFTPSVVSKPSLSPSAIATPVFEPTHPPTDRPIHTISGIPSSRPSFVLTDAPTFKQTSAPTSNMPSSFPTYSSHPTRVNISSNVIISETIVVSAAVAAAFAVLIMSSICWYFYKYPNSQFRFYLDKKKEPLLPISQERSGGSNATHRASDEQLPSLPSEVIDINWNELVPEPKDGKKIGEGGFGHVYCAHWSPRKSKGKIPPILVAVKIFKSPQMAAGDDRYDYACSLVTKEASAINRAKRNSSVVNELLVTLHGVASGVVSEPWVRILGQASDLFIKTSDKSNKMVALILKYEKGGNLKDRIHGNEGRIWIGYSTEIRLRILSEIAESICLLHNGDEETLIHGDIKPENILLTEVGPNTSIRLSDMGLSLSVKTSEHFSKASKVSTQSFYPNGGCAGGTHQYYAPELYDSSLKISKSTDIYAFGTLMWEVLSGERPWGDCTDFERRRRVVDKRETLDLTKIRMDTSTDVVGLIKDCLSMERHMRPKIGEIIRVLNCAYESMRNGVKDIFLSYAWGYDEWRKSFVNMLYTEIHLNGYSIWMDANGDGPIEMRHDIDISMINGVKNSKCGVILLSVDYINSRNCRLEFNTLIDEEKPIRFCLVEPEDQSTFWKTWKEGYIPGLSKESREKLKDVDWKLNFDIPDTFSVRQARDKIKLDCETALQESLRQIRLKRFEALQLEGKSVVESKFICAVEIAKEQERIKSTGALEKEILLTLIPHLFKKQLYANFKDAASIKDWKVDESNATEVKNRKLLSVPSALPTLLRLIKEVMDVQSSQRVLRSKNADEPENRAGSRCFIS